MKHEIKRLNLFVIAVLALFWSCQFEEEGVMQEQLHEESFTIERINGDVFRARAPKAFGKVLFLQKSMVDATENKSVAIDGVFSVETDEVLQITKGNRVSYTLPVYRFDESDLVENLVLTWQGEAGYSAKIISYILTDEERSAIEGGFFVDVSKKMLIWSLDDGNGVFSSVLNKSSSGDCFKTTIAYDMCCHNVHNTLDVQNGARCTCPSPPTGYTYVIESVSCDDDGGGGWEDPVSIDPIHSVPGDGQGSIGGGTPGESGGGTAPDDPTNTDNDPVDHFEDDLTLPVLVVRDPPTPCDKIKDGTNSVGFKQKFKELNTFEKHNLPYESGFYEKVVNGEKQYIDGVPDAEGNLLIKPSLNSTHVHNNIPKVTLNGTPYDGRIKIQSVADLMGLLRNHQITNGNTPENAFNIMISDEGIFAITILEPITLDVSLIQKISEFEDYYNKKVQDIIDALYSPSVRKRALQKMFLQGLKDTGLENKVGLFEGVVENENATDIANYNIKWTRKTLKNNFLGVSIETAPCN